MKEKIGNPIVSYSENSFKITITSVFRQIWGNRLKIIKNKKNAFENIDAKDITLWLENITDGNTNLKKKGIREKGKAPCDPNPIKNKNYT